MEVFLEEHGESIIYGLIGLVMVVTITADYIRARDYRGDNITDKVKVYGKVDVNQKGVYRLRCTVISYFNLACTKYINIIVE